MGKSRGLFLGSRPTRDPLFGIVEEEHKRKIDPDERWIDRGIQRPWAIGFIVGVFIIWIIYDFPILVLFSSSILLLILLAMPLISSILEKHSLHSWTTVPIPDILCKTSSKLPTKPIICRGIGGQRYISALTTHSAGTRLFGSLGRLIRGLSTVEGFCLFVQMWYEEEQTIISQGRTRKGISIFLEGMKQSELDGYISSRGGLWKSRTTIVAHSNEKSRLREFESTVKSILSIRTGILSGGIRKIWSRELIRRINGLSMTYEPSFYALGMELADWLIQHTDELGGEVETVIPGQFITPIRPSPIQYKIGVTYIPETYEIGPPVGFSETDLNMGVLVCGEGDKTGILTLLISQILDYGKRVLMISRDPKALNLCAISEESIGLELGTTLVLNPCDAEGIDRSEYVSRLLKALEVLPNKTHQGLSTAFELNKALGKAVALGHSTIADVRIDQDVDSSYISHDSQAGLDAIDVLRDGSGAKSFYGIQTLKMKSIDEYPLSVIVLPPTNENMERFGWDLICIKLSSLEKDPNRVIILDNPRNFKVTSEAFKRRSDWEGTVAKSVKDLGPLIICNSSPTSLGGIAHLVQTYIVTRLRSERDFAVVKDLLRLFTYPAMHTKARQGHRATGVLSTLKDSEALLMTHDRTTPIPVWIDKIPELPPFDQESMRKKIEQIRDQVITDPETTHSLIDYVSGEDSELVVEILKLLERYEPITRQGIDQFVKAKGNMSGDIDAALIRLLESSMILEGHEQHGSVSYQNYRITMKGKMALRQSEGVVT